MHEFFIFVLLITLVGCSIPLSKIWLNRRSTARDADLAGMGAELDVLRERVETLERIVTDGKYQLEHEIDQLENGSLQ